ncbi:MAG: 2-amino-4-hydroxy-6-hydroxymethyldihydropteridine diphosphokinase [Microbacteriaceae bacterium]|nr:2-amino-4-hydroxy-6-hydroxymethyldihydropteridine diphosphokinase [Microbacteriaceae bacterium]
MQRMRIELEAVIALGSNLGDRERTLREAVAAIAELDGVVLTAASEIVESAALKPEGVDAAAPRYLNAIVTARSALDPEVLLDALNDIEHRLGRVRAERWGDRTIDLDIVSMGAMTLSSARLTLPHPRAAERAFVLQPWLQLDPQACVPGEGAGTGPVGELLGRVTDRVTRFDAEPLLAHTDVQLGGSK